MEEYHSYSEYKAMKNRKKKKKLNLLGWIVITLLVIIMLAGLYYIGSLVYGLFVNTDNGSNVKQNTVNNPTVAAKQDGKIPSKNNMEIKPEAAVTYKYADKFGDARFLIHIHKLSYQLDLYEKGAGKPLKTYGIAVAKNTGDKQATGDNRTPTSWGNVVNVHSKYKGAKYKVSSTEVPFRVEEICNAQGWSHDFHDGKGIIPNAYGPWFISLDTGWDGIGIHGTHDPNSIGTDASEGCIRMINKNVDELKNIIAQHNGGIGTVVIITED